MGEVRVVQPKNTNLKRQGYLLIRISTRSWHITPKEARSLCRDIEELIGPDKFHEEIHEGRELDLP
jgi:hypothetical protein